MCDEPQYFGSSKNSTKVSDKYFWKKLKTLNIDLDRSYNDWIICPKDVVTSLSCIWRPVKSTSPVKLDKSDNNSISAARADHKTYF